MAKHSRSPQETLLNSDDHEPGSSPLSTFRANDGFSGKIRGENVVTHDCKQRAVLSSVITTGLRSEASLPFALRLAGGVHPRVYLSRGRELQSENTHSRCPRSGQSFSPKIFINIFFVVANFLHNVPRTGSTERED